MSFHIWILIIALGNTFHCLLFQSLPFTDCVHVMDFIFYASFYNHFYCRWRLNGIWWYEEWKIIHYKWYLLNNYQFYLMRASNEINMCGFESMISIYPLLLFFCLYKMQEKLVQWAYEATQWYGLFLLFQNQMSNFTSLKCINSNAMKNP